MYFSLLWQIKTVLKFIKFLLKAKNNKNNKTVRIAAPVHHLATQTKQPVPNPVKDCGCVEWALKKDEETEKQKSNSVSQTHIITGGATGTNIRSFPSSLSALFILPCWKGFTYHPQSADLRGSTKLPSEDWIIVSNFPLIRFMEKFQKAI